MHKPCKYAILTWPILCMIHKTLKGYLITSHATRTYKFPTAQKKREYRHSQIIPSSLWHNFKKLGNIRCYKRDPSNIQPAAASVAALEPSSNDAGDETPSEYAWRESEHRVGLHLGQCLNDACDGRLNGACNGRLNGACNRSQQPLKSHLNGV